MAGLDAGSRADRRVCAAAAVAFAPAALPTWLPRLDCGWSSSRRSSMLVVGTLVAWRRAPLRRRSRGALGWALVGAPLDASRAIAHFTSAVCGTCCKGGAALQDTAPRDLSRRYSELLAENLGQPGFRELLLVVHDLDARRDLVFGLVREPFRRALFPPPSGAGVRRAEAFDLAGLAREHLVDVLRAALSVPGLTEPALLSFAPDSYWRGEVHRLVDRPGEPGSIARRGGGRRRRAGDRRVGRRRSCRDRTSSRRPRLDPMGRLSEHVAARRSGGAARRRTSRPAPLPRGLPDPAAAQPRRRVRSARRIRREIRSPRIRCPS